MAVKPKLSICVPSRNRQRYFQSVITALLRSPRQDVEFVLVDNSDDPAIMDDFMARIDDPRVKYLPSPATALSMVDNWERTVEAATGDWVSVIGDDDHIDPELAGVIARLEVAEPQTEVLGWTVLHYGWPSGEPVRSNLFIPFDRKIVKMPRDLLIDRIFGWEDAEGPIPVAGMSIYHHAVRRRLLEKIKGIYGRFFENPQVDYDSALKNIVNGTGFIACQRPLSVMGVCPESNSYAASRLDDMKKKLRNFLEELGRDVNKDKEVNDFPFRIEHGLTATIGQAIQWFKTKYAFKYDGWEHNFVKACERNVEMFRAEEEFDLVRQSYQHAIDSWQDGRYKDDFNPVFRGEFQHVCATGFCEDGVYIDYNTPGVTTPSSFYDFASEFLWPLDQIDMDRHSFPTAISNAVARAAKAA